MTTTDKKRLFQQAHRLFTLGVVVERERSKLRELVERGVSYDDPEMRQALERFKAVDSEWKRLEAEHLLTALYTRPAGRGDDDDKE